MKKIIFIATVVFFTAVANSGCLKDKGFEDEKYGTQVKEMKGVAFPQAAASPVVTAITGQAAPLVVSGPIITLEQSGKPEAPVAITLQINQALVSAAGLTPLPAGSFTVSPLTVTIPAGETKSTTVKITVNNSNTLDPSTTYGVGLTIASVDGGYKIAANQSNIVMSFSIKNKYDGIYRMTGNHNRTPFTFRYDQEMHMITQGPNSVKFYWPEVKSDGHPIGTGPDPVNDVSWYGIAISPVVVFDQTTDIVTNVFNNPPQSTVITRFDGQTGANVSRFEPTTKRMIVHWNYAGNPLRAFFDTLTFISPRP
ncbi:MAG TPA: DUF1735 domain-containing protein [Flavisolibacter sp.]|jgi:hypothetical protein|nr:DUF1735 domain-containing protein [Flavisolibacter sp.]